MLEQGENIRSCCISRRVKKGLFFQAGQKSHTSKPRTSTIKNCFANTRTPGFYLASNPAISSNRFGHRGVARSFSRAQPGAPRDFAHPRRERSSALGLFYGACPARSTRSRSIRIHP